MARVASFEFYEDPVNHTNPSTCSINWAASTVVYPGVVNLPFSALDELILNGNQMADQNVTDHDVDVRRDIYSAATPPVVLATITAVPDMTAGVIDTISPGTSPFKRLKAKDLFAGLDAFILSTL